MSRADFARVKELLVELRSLAPADRSDRLARVAADDPGLRCEIEVLLGHADGPPGFLETPAFPSRSGEALAAALAAGDAAPMPEVIGRYRVLTRIATGGMGTVYKAEQDHPHRVVAVKLMRRGLMSRTALNRFQQEAEILGSLHHPGIAQIFDAGTFDDGAGPQPYFAMEFIEGVPLTAFARGRALATRQRLEVFALVCDAVEHAHRRGFIHRDLKPDNVLVQSDGAPRILDFGVAKATDADLVVTTLQTDVGQLIGTVPYMSPEQVAGDASKLDARSDVYALGVMLYELLSDRLPHDLAHRSIPEALRIIREDEPTRLSSVSTVFRGDIETLVGKAMAKERDRRYASAAELAADIRRYLADRPIVARPTSTFYQLRKFTRRNKALVGGVAATLVVLAASTAVLLRQLGVVRAAHAATGRQAYFAAISGADSSIRAGDPVAARRLLEGADPSARNWEWKYLAAQLDRSLAMIEPGGELAGAAFGAGDEVVTLSGTTLQWWDSATAAPARSVALEAESEVTVAAFTAGATLVAGILGPAGTEIGLWETSTGRRVGRFDGLETAGLGIAISPDGRFIAAKELRNVRLWDASGEFPLRNVTPNGNDRTRRMDTLRFSADGKLLTITLGSWGLIYARTIDAATGAAAWKGYEGDGTFIRAAAALRDRRSVVYGVNKKIVIQDPHAHATLATLHGHTSDITAIALSPDESLLASADSHTVRLWDLERRAAVAVIPGHVTEVRDLEFSADGTRLLSCGTKNVVRVWAVSPGDEGAVVLRGHKSWVYGVDWSPDGTRLASCAWDGRATVWDPFTSQPLADLAPKQRFLHRVRWTRDGRWIAVSASSKMVSLLDPQTGEIQRTWTVAADNPTLEVSGDGQLLATAGESGSVCLWSLPGGELVRTLGGHAGLFAKIAFSDDSRLVAACGSTAPNLRVWEVASGALMHTGPPASAVAFQPGGRVLAAGTNEGSISLWDLDAAGSELTGPLAVLRGHSDRVYALTYSPDGTRLASGSNDTTIRLWDVAGVQEVLQLRGHTQYVYDLRFSPDGSVLASASGDYTVRLWDTVPLRERRRALNEPRRTPGGAPGQSGRSRSHRRTRPRGAGPAAA